MRRTVCYSPPAGTYLTLKPRIMKTNIRNAAWAIGVLLLAGFCWVGCDRRLDVRTVYPFRVTTMPIPKTITPGKERFHFRRFPPDDFCFSH